MPPAKRIPAKRAPTKRVARSTNGHSAAPQIEMTEGQQRLAAVRAASSPLVGARTARLARGGVRESSFPDNPAAIYSSVFGQLYQQYAPLAYWLPWEVLDYIELLSTYNPDFSQAVDNIRTLANSGHQLIVTTDEGEGINVIQQEVKAKLEEKARTIQARNGGIDGLVDKLLDQAAVYGAMCGEWVLTNDLSDVVDFAEVNPKTIRFFWDEGTQQWMPFQKVSLFQAKEAESKGQMIKNMNYVALNPATFFYYAFDAAPGSPYGTPPFTASLANIAIQRDMITNMAQIVKKIGLLGIIDFVVKQLPQDPGETDEGYAARANNYLDTYVAAIENMVRDGGIVHFDDSEAQSYSIAGNAAGATAIFKQNEELIFSGLKSMPSVQGRSYSTTETYAGVAYDIIIRNTTKYQRACKRMIEAGYMLMITAWGYDPNKVKVSLDFNSNKTLHRLQDAQSELMEIRNSLMLWAAGIIDQTAVAQRHGYDQPMTAFDEPPDSGILGNGSPGGGSGASSIGVGDTPGAAAGGGGEGKAFDDLFRDRIIELGKAASKSKRRSRGRDLAQQTLDLQDEFEKAGKKPIDELMDGVLKVLELGNANS